MISSPSVMTAMENSGLPIIGRIVEALDDQAERGAERRGRRTR